MGVWQYTGLAVILMLIYYNKNARKTVKSIAMKIVDVIENGVDL